MILLVKQPKAGEATASPASGNQPGRAAPQQLDREERERRDLEIIDRHAKRLNREALDVLRSQKLI